MDRELDVRVAKALGYTVYHYDKDYAKNCYYQLFDGDGGPVVYTNGWRDGERKTEEEAWNDVPRFSTDLAAAWALVEYLIDNQMDTEVHCTRAQRNYFVLVHIIGGRKIREYADTAPEAICKAFLAALA